MSMSPKQKVYQGVLQELRKFIDSNDLVPGDKLPSERELSERLQAGRSSIREALRAMELLGLIETRHGEGTYLSTYRPYQTVELLASFILRENNTRNDLMLAKRIMEKEAAKMAYNHVNKNDINSLLSVIHDRDMNPNERHVVFFQYLFKKAENLLLTKIWELMDEFSNTITKLSYEDTFYLKLIQLYKTRNFEMIEGLFENVPTR
nr:GntR family transcriptional regulator [Virgibacillus doumboii]